jgi:hypothetical protein
MNEKGKKQQKPKPGTGPRGKESQISARPLSPPAVPQPPPRTWSESDDNGEEKPAEAGRAASSGRRSEGYDRARLGLALHSARAVGLVVYFALVLLVGAVIARLTPFAAVGSIVAAVVGLGAALLGVVGSTLCCWLPARTGSREPVVAALALDLVAFLVSALGGLAAVAVGRFPVLVVGNVVSHLLAPLAALAASVLILLFLRRLASSLGKRSLDREARSILLHLGILTGSVLATGVLLVVVAPFVAGGVPIGGGLALGGGFPVFVLFMVLRWRRLFGHVTYRTVESAALSGAYARADLKARTAPRLRFPLWALFFPMAAAVLLTGSLLFSRLVGLAVLALLSLVVLGVAVWLVVRFLTLVGALRAVLPTSGRDTGEVLRGLPGWFWAIPPGAGGVVLGAFVLLLAFAWIGDRSGHSAAWVALNTPAPANRVNQAQPLPPPAPAPAREPAPKAPPPELPHKVPPPATDFPGLIGYWPFEDDGPMQRVADRSGNGNDGKAIGAGRVEGVRGRALAFADRGYLDYGSRPGLDVPDGGPFTVACWVKTTADKGTVVSQRHNKDEGARIGLALSGGHAQALVRRSGGVFSPSVDGKAVVNNGRWHHLAVLRSGKNVELYVDGELDASFVPADGPGPITTNLRAVGRDGWDYQAGKRGPEMCFTGAVDEVCIFNRALLGSEIRALAGR